MLRRMTREIVIGLIPQRVVTLAGTFFEAAPVENFDLASFVANQSFALQPSCQLRNRRPANAEHLRKKLLRERYCVAVKPVSSL